MGSSGHGDGLIWTFSSSGPELLCWLLSSWSRSPHPRLTTNFCSAAIKTLEGLCRSKPWRHLTPGLCAMPGLSWQWKLGGLVPAAQPIWAKSTAHGWATGVTRAWKGKSEPFGMCLLWRWDSASTSTQFCVIASVKEQNHVHFSSAGRD